MRSRSVKLSLTATISLFLLLLLILPAMARGEVTAGAAPRPPLAVEAISPYSFITTTTTYTEITSGTLHGAGTGVDDNSYNAINIGFTFTFNKVAFTQVSINANGFVALGSSVSSSYVPLSGGTSNNVIAALANDLRGNTGGSLRSELIGSAPNRVFVIQWKDFGSYYSTMPGDESYNFQIRLYETSNRIELVYGPFTKNGTNRTVQVGLRGASSADYKNLRTPTTTSGSWNAPQNGTSNADTMALVTGVLPSAGLVYQFDPPPPAPDYSTSTKTVSPTGTRFTGDVLTYTVAIINSGDLTGTTTTLSDPIPTGTTYVDGSAQVTGGGTLTATAGSIDWSGEIAAGARVTVTFQVTLTAINGSITNTATISDPAALLTTVKSASTAVAVPNYSTSTKTATPATGSLVNTGDLITYTVTVINSGQLTGTASLVDYAPAGTAYVPGSAVVLGGGTLTENNGIEWTGPISVGGRITATFSAAVTALNGVIVNTATISDPITLAPVTKSTSHTVRSPIFSTSTKTASAVAAAGGSPLTYTIRIVNSGALSATNATMTDVLPAEFLPNLDAIAASSGSVVTNTSPTISWNGVVTNGATIVITIPGTIDPAACGVAIVNSAVIADPLAATYTTTAQTMVYGPITTFSESFDGVTFPPSGWASVALTTTGATAPAWARSTATVHPSGFAPFSGAGLAYFNSYSASAGSASRLSSPAISLIANTDPTVLFYVYHDTGFTTNADYVQVQASTDGVNWSNVGLPVYRYDGSTGWKAHAVSLKAYEGQSVQLGFLGVSAFGNDVHIDHVSVRTCCEPPAGVSFTFDPASPLTNQPIDFTATVLTGTAPFTYTWDFGDGSPIGNGNPISHTYTTAATYNVTLTVDCKCGTASVTQAISPSDAPTPPTLGALQSSSPTALGNATYFTGTLLSGSAPITYTWDFGDGTVIEDGLTVNHTYTQTGLYTVTLTADNAAGSDVASTTVDVGLAPTASFTSDSPAVWPNTTINFTFTGSNAASYLWSFGDGITSTAQNPTHTYPLLTFTKVYTVNLSVSNPYGSASASDQVVVVNDYPAFTGVKSGPPAAINQGTPLTYTIRVTNTGTLSASNASLVDTFPIGSAGPAAIVEASSGSIASNTATGLTWNGSLEIGQSVTLTFVLTPTAACGTQVLTNTAVISDATARAATTLTAPPTTVYYNLLLNEGFESATFPPTGWTRYNVDGAGMQWARNTTAAYVHSGVASAYHAYGPVGTMENGWLVAPPLSVQPGTRLSFWEYTQFPTFYYKHSLWVCTGASCNNPPTNYTQVAEFGSVAAAWRQQTVDLSAYAGQTAYLAWRYEGDDADTWYIDDVLVQVPCPSVTIAPNAQALMCPGTTATYVQTVSNLTGSTDDINITKSASLFNTLITPASFTAVGPYQTRTTTVTVDVPWTATPGATDVVTLTATGVNSGLSGQSVLRTTAATFGGWSDKAASPKGARYSAVVYDNGYLYQIGGENPASTAISDTFRYSIAANTWATMTGMITRAYGIDAVAINGNLYVAGGYSGSAYLSDLQVYSTTANIWTSAAPMPTPLAYYQAVALNGKLYVLGGFGGLVTPAVSNAVYVYDPATNSWSTAAPMSIPRYYAHAGVIGGQIYVAGGYTGTTVIAASEVYSPAGNSWSPIAPMPMPWVQGGDAVVRDRYLVVSGGYSTTLTASVYGAAYDAQTNTWAMIPDRTSLRYGAEADSNGTDFYLIAGRESVNSVFIMSNRNEVLAGCPVCQSPTNLNFSVGGNPQPGQTLTFTGTAQGTGPLTYAWAFGDGGTASGQTATHSYASAGQYTVVMTVTGPCGTGPVTYSRVVDIGVQSFTFTYHDLEDVVLTGEQVYIAGTFNGWNANANPLNGDAGATTFSVTLQLLPGSYEYKYIVKSGGDQWDWLNTNNRARTLTVSGVVDDYRNVVPGYQHIMSPAVLTGTVGRAAGPIVSEVYINNVTNPNGAGRGLKLETGYGNTPAYTQTWTWQGGVMAYAGQNGNNDIYHSFVTPMATGVYSFAVRYNGNWGAGNPNSAWWYGDLRGVFPGQDFTVTEAGVLNVIDVKLYLPIILR